MDTQDYLPYVFSAIFFLLGIICGYFLHKVGHKYAGDIEVIEDEDGVKRFSLMLNSDPDDLDTFKEVTFKIKSSP